MAYRICNMFFINSKRTHNTDKDHQYLDVTPSCLHLLNSKTLDFFSLGGAMWFTQRSPLALGESCLARLPRSSGTIPCEEHISGVPWAAVINTHSCKHVPVSLHNETCVEVLCSPFLKSLATVSPWEKTPNACLHLSCVVSRVHCVRKGYAWFGKGLGRISVSGLILDWADRKLTAQPAPTLLCLRQAGSQSVCRGLSRSLGWVRVWNFTTGMENFSTLAHNQRLLNNNSSQFNGIYELGILNAQFNSQAKKHKTRTPWAAKDYERISNKRLF